MSEELNNSALPGVVIVIGNGALGTVSTDDSIAGMVLESYATAIAFGSAKVIYSRAEAEALGITSAKDSQYHMNVYGHISKFFAVAGDGSELWLMLAAQGTSLSALADPNGPFAPELLALANGRIRLLGIGHSTEPTNHDYSEGLEADTYLAMAYAQAAAQASAVQMSPVRVVIGGNRLGDVGNLRDLKQEACPRVQILVGASSPGRVADVGLLLGRYAADPVQRNPGRVASGSLPLSAAYLTNGSQVLAQNLGIATVHEKGYVGIRNFVGRSGFYFTDDPTCTATTDDYRSFARGRVMDKAVLIAYQVYTGYVLDEISVNDNGEMDAGRVKELQSKIETAINQAMTSQGEISAVSVNIPTVQDVATTGILNVYIDVSPVGYLKKIRVTIGFANSNNT